MDLLRQARSRSPDPIAWAATGASFGGRVAISQPGFDGCRKFFDGCDVEEFHFYATVPIKTSFDFVKIYVNLIRSIIVLSLTGLLLSLACCLLLVACCSDADCSAVSLDSALSVLGLVAMSLALFSFASADFLSS